LLENRHLKSTVGFTFRSLVGWFVDSTTAVA